VLEGDVLGVDEADPFSAQTVHSVHPLGALFGRTVTFYVIDDLLIRRQPMPEAQAQAIDYELLTKKVGQRPKNKHHAHLLPGSPTKVQKQHKSRGYGNFPRK
jgi:hypothetical protein